MTHPKKTLRDEMREEVSKEVIAILKDTDFDFGFCIDDHDRCDRCREVVHRLVNVALRTAGFDTESE